jgi:DNA-binding MarR family transcriptional regulator
MPREKPSPLGDTPSRQGRTAAVSELEAHLGYWLRFVSNHVSHSFRRRVEGRGVTVAEWVVMRELYRLGPVSPSALVDALGMTPGAVSRLLSRVEAKGLASRKTVAEDRRRQTVALTSSGRRLVPGLAALADENDAEFFGGLPDADRQTLHRILKDLVRAHGLKSVPVD